MHIFTVWATKEFIEGFDTMGETMHGDPLAFVTKGSITPRLVLPLLTYPQRQ